MLLVLLWAPRQHSAPILNPQVASRLPSNRRTGIPFDGKCDGLQPAPVETDRLTNPRTTFISRRQLLPFGTLYSSLQVLRRRLQLGIIRCKTLLPDVPTSMQLCGGLTLPAVPETREEALDGTRVESAEPCRLRAPTDLCNVL